jgi:hypothetical protein
MAWNVSGSWNGANSSVLAGEGFTRIGTLTVPALGAGVTATNVPLVIRPQLEFTTLMLSKIKADGGDLRLSSDAAGNSELPKELVKFDKTTGDIVWSNFPSVVEGLVYHVWAQKPAATQPAVGGEFGRNAVWVDYNRVYHLNEAVSTATGNYVDSSGNGDGTLNATNNVTSVTGQIGDATQSLNSAGGSSPLIDTGLVPDATNVRTLEFWVNYSTTSNSSGYAQGSDDANNRRFYVGLDGDVRLFAGVGTGFMGFGTNPNPSGIVAGSWYKQSLSVDGSTATVYVNGVPKGSFAYTFSGTSTSNFTILGRNRATVETRIQGIADLYTIGKNEKSANHLKIEYQNQSATTAWWIAADVGGTGGPFTITLPPLVSTVIFYDPSILKDKLLLPTFIASTEVVSDLTVKKDKQVNLGTLNSTSVVYEPSMIQAKFLLPATIATTSVVYNLSLLKDKLLLLQTIATTTVVYDPAVKENKFLFPEFITSTTIVGEPTVIGGYRPIAAVKLYSAEGYGVHIRSAKELYEVVKVLVSRIEALERSL